MWQFSKVLGELHKWEFDLIDCQFSTMEEGPWGRQVLGCLYYRFSPFPVLFISLSPTVAFFCPFVAPSRVTVYTDTLDGKG